MIYNENEMTEIGRDPVRCRAYFWRVAQNARRMAERIREDRRRGIFNETAIDAHVMDSWATVLLENLDAMVASCMPDAVEQPEENK